jgi:hypothetical protein
MRCLEAREARQHPEARDADAGAEHHRRGLAAGAQFAQDVLQLLESRVRAAEQARPFGRERDGAVAALEQAHAQLVLQRGDLAADGRLSQAKVGGGVRDAHAAADGDEAAHEIERGEFQQGQ